MRTHTQEDVDHDINPIDAFIGKRVRERRQRLGWTLMDLAERLSVSHQQVQKYEHGTTRISAGTLYHLSQIFQTNQNYFFMGISKNGPDNTTGAVDTINLGAEKHLNIVLIEDDAADELLMRKALESLTVPFNLHSLHDGESALQFLRRGTEENFFPRPDVIILDLNLPRRDGHLLLKDIKRDRNLQDIPVVILTNSLSKKEMVSTYQAGASGYICKSFDFDVFKSHVQNFVSYWVNTVVLPGRN